jgi:hypothetical protein
MKELLSRVAVLTLGVGLVFGSFFAVKTLACGDCGYKFGGDWLGNCGEINNPGCGTGQVCEFTTCIQNPGCTNQSEQDVTLCTLIQNCVGHGDPLLPKQCTSYTPNCQKGTEVVGQGTN